MFYLIVIWTTIWITFSTVIIIKSKDESERQSHAILIVLQLILLVINILRERGLL